MGITLLTKEITPKNIFYRNEIQYRDDVPTKRKVVLFREVFSHPYISLFHLLVNGFSVTCNNNNYHFHHHQLLHAGFLEVY